MNDENNNNWGLNAGKVRVWIYKADSTKSYPLADIEIEREEETITLITNTGVRFGVSGGRAVAYLHKSGSIHMCDDIDRLSTELINESVQLH